MARANIVEKEWKRALKDELNNNMLFDTPKGKTAFACGVAFVLKRLKKPADHEQEWNRILDDAIAFSDAYMAESVRLKAQRREFEERMRDIFPDPEGGPPLPQGGAPGAS